MYILGNKTCVRSYASTEDTICGIHGGEGTLPWILQIVSKVEVHLEHLILFPRIYTLQSYSRNFTVKNFLELSWKERPGILFEYILIYILNITFYTRYPVNPFLTHTVIILSSVIILSFAFGRPLLGQIIDSGHV